MSVCVRPELRINRFIGAAIVNKWVTIGTFKSQLKKDSSQPMLRLSENTLKTNGKFDNLPQSRAVLTVICIHSPIFLSRTCLQERMNREADMNKTSFVSSQKEAFAYGSVMRGSGSGGQAKVHTSVDVHVPTRAAQHSKAKVEEAIEKLQNAEEGGDFEEAHEVLRKALEDHHKVLGCQKRCEDVKGSFQKGGHGKS